MAEITEAPARPEPLTSTPPKARTLLRCARHRGVDALVRCDRCNTRWCDACVTSGTDRGVVWHHCKCGGRGVELPAIEEMAPGGYERSLGQAFKAPLTSDGLKLLAVGSIVFGLLEVLCSMLTGLFAAVGVAVITVVVGYQLEWAMSIIRDAARGRPALVSFPDFTSIGESIARPLGQVLVVVAATLGPGIVVWMSGWLGALLGPLLLLCGLVVLPMALGSVAIEESLRGLEPLRVLRAIAIGGAEYGLAASLFVAMAGAMLGGSVFLGGVPWIGPIVKSFFCLWCIAVASQLVGLVIARKDDRLGWIGRAPTAR